ADDSAGVTREAQRVADREPDDRRPAHRDEALHHDREHVLPADEPAVEERQPWRHEHHQARAQQHEAGVAGIESWHVSPHAAVPSGLTCSRRYTRADAPRSSWQLCYS